MTTQSNSDGPLGAIGSVQEEFEFVKNLGESTKHFHDRRKSLLNDLKHNPPSEVEEEQGYLWAEGCSEF